MSARRYWIYVALITLATAVRIASTHLVFAQTMDEPVHVAGGHEWLTKGTYHLDPEHPPLPRVLFALPFRNVRSTATNSADYGNDIYGVNGRYIHNVAGTRRGNLVFFVIAALALAACARRLFGEVVALVALLLFANLPPVLAHAGLATTDMAAVAAFAVALHALVLWTDEPSWPRTIYLGATIAFGLACKYSMAVFFPAAMVIVLVARRRFAPARLLVAILVGALLTWAAFGFKFSSMAEAHPGAVDRIRGAQLPESWTQIPVPAPDLALGMVTVRMHNNVGHDSYLFGKVSRSGWWYYFPVALALKTPIPYLLLALAGIVLVLMRRRGAAFLIVVALAVLAIAMSSRINIGVRHIMAMYVPLSMIAAFAVVELWRAGRVARGAVALAMAWLLFSGARAHPDYLPWMNAFAGERPYEKLLDSNFDWGQDIWRLARVCHKRGITWLGYAVITGVRPSSIGITGGEPLREEAPTHGWLVISEHSLAWARASHPHAYDWLEQQPRFERVGKTLRLYHVP